MKKVCQIDDPRKKAIKIQFKCKISYLKIALMTATKKNPDRVEKIANG